MARPATDRRVTRTRELLRSALFELVHQRGFETLTVQDVIDHANVGRATFYAHFDNKEDLLLSGFKDLRASLRQTQRAALARRDAAPFAFSRDLFAHAREFDDLFRCLIGKRSGAAVSRKLYEVIADLVREDVHAARPRASAASREPLVQFIAGGFFSLLAWWRDGRMRVSVDDVDAMFKRFAIPALSRADHPTPGNHW